MPDIQRLNPTPCQYAWRDNGDQGIPNPEKRAPNPHNDAFVGWFCQSDHHRRQGHNQQQMPEPFQHPGRHEHSERHLEALDQG